MKKDFLIIGRGLAGAILSLRLIERGMTHDIIDEPTLSASSKVAAGVINPIVLKRLKMVHGAPGFIQSAHAFYTDWEARTDCKFYNEIPIAHIFQSVGELNNWYEKQANESFSTFLGEVHKIQNEKVPAPLGLGMMKNTAWLDTESFLNMQAEQLTGPNELVQAQFTPNKLEQLQAQYHHIVICTGHLMRKFFIGFEDIFTPTRGEVMIIETDDLQDDYILHGPVFILPLGNNRFKVGATYRWDNLKDETSPEGLRRLQEDLGKIFTGSYEIVDHQAGVRPNIKDRKPLLGHLQDNLYSFNGLGSRGALMAPLLANQLLDYILERKTIDPAYDLARFQV